MTLSTLSVSQAVKTPRVSACEPLCARLGAGVACVPDEGCFAHARRTLRRYKNRKDAAVTRGRPAFQQHESRTEGSDTTPMQERRKSAVCRREQRVRRHRAPTLRKPFFCRNKPRAGLFRHSHSGPRVMIPPPHGNAENAKRESYHLPRQGSHRNPAKRFRREEDERQRERVLPLAAGRGIHRPLGRRPASHLSGLRRSRCPAKCTGRGKALHPNSGRKPGPTFSYDWRKT